MELKGGKGNVKKKESRYMQVQIPSDESYHYILLKCSQKLIFKMWNGGDGKAVHYIELVVTF